jgi:hypothetical protein
MPFTYCDAILGLCFFMVPLWAYRKGLKDGLAINRGAGNIEPIRSPIQIMKQQKEVKAAKIQQDKMLEGLQNLLSYDGSKQEGSEG